MQVKCVAKKIRKLVYKLHEAYQTNEKCNYTAKINVVCTSEKFTLKVKLSAGNHHGAPESRKFIELLIVRPDAICLLTVLTKDNETQTLALR